MPSRRLLTVDYPGIEQRARVADLVDDIPDIEVHHLMTLPLPAERSTTAFAKAVLSACTPGLDPLVVAYCMGTPIAHEVAAATGARSLIALDGSPCPADFVAQTYRVQLSRFAERTVEPAVVFDADDLLRRPDDVLDRMTRELTAVVSSFFADMEGEDDVTRAIGADLVGRTVDWMAHLITAHNAAFTPWPGEVVLVASREAVFHGPWPGAAKTTVVRIDCARDELIGHPVTRSVVLDRL